MENELLEYLTLLDGLRNSLEQLTELDQQKTAAVRKDDLATLNEILKKEQALSLSLRGQEQKRLKLAEALGFQSVPLQQLPNSYPDSLHLRAKETVEKLSNQYEIYRCAAEVARNTLECNLHEVEKVLEQMGGDVPLGPGYTAPDIDPPAAMKTDFRA